MLRFSDYTLDVAFFSILDKLTNPYRNFLSINNKRIFSNTKKNLFNKPGEGENQDVPGRYVLSDAEKN